jgi:hypothetical protein
MVNFRLTFRGVGHESIKLDLSEMRINVQIQMQMPVLRGRIGATMNFPTVTQIINPWMDWSMIPPGTLQYAADRGTLIHDLCARHSKGHYVVTADEYRPYLESFQQWFELMVKEVILVEERMYDTVWLYSGQIDLLAVLNDGRIALCDEKTPITTQKSWRVQLAGYHNLCKVNGYSPVCNGSLQLSPKGKMAKMTWYESTAADLNQFLTDLNSYRYYHS